MNAPVTFYRPDEVAERLRCSQWWVKEQARQRRIPHCWIGGSYRFTEEHITEIARLFEVQPIDAVTPASTPRQTPRRSAGDDAQPVVHLSARIPRRARAAASNTAA